MFNEKDPARDGGVDASRRDSVELAASDLCRPLHWLRYKDNKIALAMQGLHVRCDSREEDFRSQVTE